MFSLKARRQPRPTLFPYTTLFRSYPSAKPGRLLPDSPAQPGKAPAARRPALVRPVCAQLPRAFRVDRKSTRLNSSHVRISYAVFCLKKKKIHGEKATLDTL